jgi:Raf kinase inhibitor-like YbhB/YbcL family protein
MNTITAFIMVIAASKTLRLTSPAFENDEFIPSTYTCAGNNTNPELIIENIPELTISLALVVDDPDAPGGTFDHWLMWNIPVVEVIAENSTPGVEGKNGKDKIGYTGPCPPEGIHHYHFRLYALDTKLDLPEGSTKQELLKAMDGHILALGELVGLFRK